MRNWILILGIIIGLTNCKESPVKTSAKKETAASKVDNSDLATRLYSGYVKNATDQAHIDQNLLIDYALQNDIDVTRTSSGLYYIITKEGQGALLNNSEMLSVDYEGAFLDGKVFDSSYKRGEPIVFRIGQMIAGWNEGLTYLKHGSEATFLIPSRLAYGDRGFPNFVPPNKALVFKIKVH